jgi:alanyl-tRNA synthetase
MTEEEVARVEQLVDERIGQKLPVYAEVAPQEQALKIFSLRAVFGEKYPPMVRVVSIGVPLADLLKDPSNQRWRQYSIEFCGGTHLRNTGDVEGFVITSEESVSKGIRRLVALTGVAASAAMSSTAELDRTIDRARKVPESDLAQTINALQKQLGAENIPLRAKRRGQVAVAELQAKQKTWEKSQAKSSGAAIDVAQVAAGLLNNGNVIVESLGSVSDEQIRSVIDSIKKRSPSFAALLVGSDGQKLSFVAAVSDDLIAKGLKAGDWVREAAKAAGGGGGGRPQMAQAGGKDPSKLGDALHVAREFARSRIG